ncbi:hypothetical protein [Nostoc sp. UIC 10630]|uniref:hypothetical protein n=1 Tax=Nostoc sp. UIC 10630 TaxID=2100146 RepID=UPI0013D56F18|nr:hypothetical protein [Nostoc sp. UIC 10630]NEU79885.1 hypothetical protein [Nostoc sp. UIC 10630]
MTNLSSVHLAIVGGHPRTRQTVIQALKREHGLKKCLEVPPSSETRTSTKKLKAKLSHCDLILIIPGYLSHATTEIIFHLKRSKALKGKLLMLPSCRGISGVLREILKHAAQAYC